MGGGFLHVDRAGGFGGVLIESSQRHPGSDPRPLKGIQPKGSSLNPVTPSCMRTVADLMIADGRPFLSIVFGQTNSVVRSFGLSVLFIK